MGELFEVWALKTPVYWCLVDVWIFLLNNNSSLLCHFHTLITKTVVWTYPGKIYSEVMVAVEILMEE